MTTANNNTIKINGHVCCECGRASEPLSNGDYPSLCIRCAKENKGYDSGWGDAGGIGRWDEES